MCIYGKACLWRCRLMAMPAGWQRLLMAMPFDGNAGWMALPAYGGADLLQCLRLTFSLLHWLTYMPRPADDGVEDGGDNCSLGVVQVHAIGNGIRLHVLTP